MQGGREAVRVGVAEVVVVRGGGQCGRRRFVTFVQATLQRLLQRMQLQFGAATRFILLAHGREAPTQHLRLVLPVPQLAQHSPRHFELRRRLLRRHLYFRRRSDICVQLRNRLAGTGTQADMSGKSIARVEQS